MSYAAVIKDGSVYSSGLLSEQSFNNSFEKEYDGFAVKKIFLSYNVDNRDDATRGSAAFIDINDTLYIRNMYTGDLVKLLDNVSKFSGDFYPRFSVVTIDNKLLTFDGENFHSMSDNHIFIDVAGSGSYLVALDVNGNLWGYGDNLIGLFDKFVEKNGFLDELTQLTYDVVYTQIAAFSSRFVALDSNGSIHLCEKTRNGQRLLKGLSVFETDFPVARFAASDYRLFLLDGSGNLYGYGNKKALGLAIYSEVEINEFRRDTYNDELLDQYMQQNIHQNEEVEELEEGEVEELEEEELEEGELEDQEYPDDIFENEPVWLFGPNTIEKIDVEYYEDPNAKILGNNIFVNYPFEWKIYQVACLGSSVYVLFETGELFVCGGNLFGELGVGRVSFDTDTVVYQNLIKRYKDDTAGVMYDTFFGGFIQSKIDRVDSLFDQDLPARFSRTKSSRKLAPRKN